MHWTINLDAVNTVVSIIVGLLAIGAAGLGLKRIVVKAIARQLVPVQTSLTRTAHGISRVVESTEQLRHNGGSHVADYARDARDLSLQTLARLDVQDAKIEETSRAARDAARMARDSRGAAARAASHSRDVGERLTQHLAWADQIVNDFQQQLDDNRRRDEGTQA